MAPSWGCTTAASAIQWLSWSACWRNFCSLADKYESCASSASSRITPAATVFWISATVDCASWDNADEVVAAEAGEKVSMACSAVLVL